MPDLNLSVRVQDIYLSVDNIHVPVKMYSIYFNCGITRCRVSCACDSYRLNCTMYVLYVYVLSRRCANCAIHTPAEQLPHRVMTRCVSCSAVKRWKLYSIQTWRGGNCTLYSVQSWRGGNCTVFSRDKVETVQLWRSGNCTVVRRCKLYQLQEL